MLHLEFGYGVNRGRGSRWWLSCGVHQASSSFVLIPFLFHIDALKRYSLQQLLYAVGSLCLAPADLQQFAKSLRSLHAEVAEKPAVSIAHRLIQPAQ